MISIKVFDGTAGFNVFYSVHDVDEGGANFISKRTLFLQSKSALNECLTVLGARW